jgi:hypothetical protein
MEKIEQNQISRNIRIIGVALILLGVATLADQLLHTGYLVICVFTLSGLLMLFLGILRKNSLLLIFGNLISSVGFGLAFVFFNRLTGLRLQAGVLMIALGIGWALIFVMALLFINKRYFWSLIPAAVLFAVGYCLTFNHLRWVDFVLTGPMLLGLALLLWGTVEAKLGLIIPGSLLFCVGLGIYFGWGSTNEQNYLAQTGIMLVIFALGWLLITLFSRVITDKFVWWPLIPGGILAMVGWGLYIGGNPGNALSFIGNTGSVGLIILGIYLLLFKRGIQH